MCLFVLIALVGATLIVVHGSIFGFLRKRWPALFKCAQCVGMWVGIIAGACGLIDTGHNRIVDAFLVGAATSISSLLIYGLLIVLLGEPEEH